MFTNHSREVVDAVTLDFVKPIGDTVTISTILQKKIMMLTHLILQLVLCVIIGTWWVAGDCSTVGHYNLASNHLL